MLPVAERFCRTVEEVTGETFAANPPTVRDQKGVLSTGLWINVSTGLSTGC